MLSERTTHSSDGAESAEPEDPVWSSKTYSRANLLGAAVATGFGIAIIMAARGYALFVQDLPGPGLYPMIIGIAMTTLGVAWAVGTWFGRYAPAEDTGAPPERGAVIRSLLTLLTVTGFVFALNPIGYPISAAVVVTVFVLLARGSLRKALVTGPVFAIASYLLITTALGVPLNLGLLEPYLGFLR